MCSYLCMCVCVYMCCFFLILFFFLIFLGCAGVRCCVVPGTREAAAGV